MAILNTKTNEIQLIDSKYNINPNLFRASKMSCIGNINNDNSKELITVMNNNILICYQIPIFKLVNQNLFIYYTVLYLTNFIKWTFKKDFPILK